MLRLSGKVAFITGGGTGSGRACGLAFAREGAEVAIAGRRKEPLDNVAREIAAAGGKSFALSCDVTERSSVESTLAQAEKHFGRLDTIVNSAGAVVVATAEHTSDADWNRVLAANLTGTFFVSRAALAPLRMAGGGSIINIGSVLGLVARKERAAYCAAKAGVSGLTRAMALDHAHEKIRVNCICPTLVETELGMLSIQQTANAVAEIEKRIAEIPIGRLGKPEDVARMAVYLASEEASWVTGASFPLDGGLTAYLYGAISLAEVEIRRAPGRRRDALAFAREPDDQTFWICAGRGGARQGRAADARRQETPASARRGPRRRAGGSGGYGRRPGDIYDGSARHARRDHRNENQLSGSSRGRQRHRRSDRGADRSARSRGGLRYHRRCAPPGGQSAHDVFCGTFPEEPQEAACVTRSQDPCSALCPPEHKSPFINYYLPIFIRPSGQTRLIRCFRWIRWRRPALRRHLLYKGT